MTVILDDLNAKEFFESGGVVKIQTKNEEVCELVSNQKKPFKQTFLDDTSYLRFFRCIYLRYQNRHNGISLKDSIKEVNSSLKISATIGNKSYQIGTDDEIKSLDMCKFHYLADNESYGYKKDISQKDAYGLTNVNFSVINPEDNRWDEFKKQRIIRGFDDTELWNLDSTIANFVYPRLVRFKEIKVGYPGCFSSNEEWDNVLSKIIKGFELMCDDNVKKEDEDIIINEALCLFSKHFGDLWD